MLFEESGIAPEIVAERGYWTVRSRAELSEFPPWQRRLGLYVPIYSPDGETVRCQLRPDKRRKGGPKYETPQGGGYTLDCHPRMMEAVRDPDRELWVTEGCKKVDSLASHGVPCIGLVGVHMFAVAGTGGNGPLDCWKHVPLKGRLVRVVFDSDCMEKEGVHLALERLVRILEERGAEVRVVYLPAGVGGEKVGMDDYLAAGGTVAELKMLARKFEPEDLGRIRLSRDEKLRAAVGYLWRRWRAGDWTRFVGAAPAEKGNWARGHTARDTMEALIELAALSGKADGRGVVVRVGLRALSDKAAKTAPSVGKAVKHLEADGQLEILPPKDKSSARSYRLLVESAALYSMEKGSTGTEESEERDRRCKGLRAPSAPRLRWSSPGRPRRREFEVVKGTKGRVRHTGKVPRDALGEDLEARPYVKRLGPHRGAVLDTLEAAGGEMRLSGLCEALHRKRPRDVRRRILEPLREAGIIECEGDVVRLAAEWLARLEEERDRKGEIGQAEWKVERHREERAKYREHLERKRRGTPKASLDAERRSRELRERRLSEIRDEEERDRAPAPPAVEALVTRTLGRNDRIRLGLLCEIAREEGLRWRDVPPAVRRMGYRVERLPEYGNNEFVFAKPEVGREDLRNETKPEMELWVS